MAVVEVERDMMQIEEFMTALFSNDFGQYFDIVKLDRNMASSLLHGLYLLGKTCFKIVFSK